MERRSVLRFLLVFLLSLCAEGASIALGEGHSCVSLTGGTVKCWGFNNFGQLGNGTLGSGTDSPTPVDVSGITTATSLALGGSSENHHSCALLTGGTVKCWGSNNKGQLGNETTANSATPVDVSGITTATSIAVGGQFSCAVLTGGTVKCWGSNNYGQLGNGTTANSATPVDVADITTATSIADGTYHSCALLTGGTVKCWGYNGNGQLGDGSTTDSATPVDVTGITTATSIAAGTWHSCALLTGGTVKCWGFNSKGQLGNGTIGSGTDRPTPVDVFNITTATSIALAHQHACALLTDGTIMCWGYNYYSQLGDRTLTSRSKPVFALQISVLPRPCTCCESELKRFGFSAGAECHVEL